MTSQVVISGVRADRIEGAVWRKSRHSAPGGNCVELAVLSPDRVAVRDSRHPDGPALVYGAAEMAAFISAVAEGQFDSPGR